jgi:hypothetical protein
MQNILVRLKPELKIAIELIRKNAGSRFHVIASESGTVLKSIPAGTLNSCKIGFYSAKSLEVGGSKIERLVSNAKKSAKWPKTISYLNGVVFVDVDQDEAEIETDPDELAIVIENEYTTEPDSDELGTIGTELIDDEFDYDEPEETEL